MQILYRLLNAESVELGFILKQIPGYEFSMERFKDRLRLQKTVYMLQTFGVYLGYDFSWYLRGPYCSLLVHNGLHLQTIYEKVPDNVTIKHKKDRRNFDRFKKFIKGKSMDDLEIATALHYLKETSEMREEEIKASVAAKQKKFKNGRIDRIWDELKSAGIL